MAMRVRGISVEMQRIWVEMRKMCGIMVAMQGVKVKEV